MVSKTLEALKVSREEYNEIIEEIEKRSQPAIERQYSPEYIRTVKQALTRRKNRRQTEVLPVAVLHR
ncbi:hypothetical protein [Priestia megaterium]|uniref:hypothetical protein n=1 Tax=Priestia megaterium TaxID=1404 RepID=UPI0011A0DC17|nr:hypothetical protein [Priestia megaterium]